MIIIRKLKARLIHNDRHMISRFRLLHWFLSLRSVNCLSAFKLSAMKACLWSQTRRPRDCTLQPHDYSHHWIPSALLDANTNCALRSSKDCVALHLACNSTLSAKKFAADELENFHLIANLVGKRNPLTGNAYLLPFGHQPRNLATFLATGSARHDFRHYESPKGVPNIFDLIYCANMLTARGKIVNIYMANAAVVSVVEWYWAKFLCLLKKAEMVHLFQLFY